MIKLKYKDIPDVKEKIARSQLWFCPICNRNLYQMKRRDICLDHDHKTGYIRAVLCRGCNSAEGKFYRTFVRLGLQKQGVDYYTFLLGLAEYTKIQPTEYIHPKFKEKKK